MRILFVVNDPAEIVPTQTTAMLMAAAARRGHQVWVSGVADLEVDATGIAARALPGERPAAAASMRLRVEELDAMLLRTNPARDRGRPWAHAAALGVARLARDRGVLVLNDPDALARAADKLVLFALPPSVRPPTLVTRDAAALHAFVASSEGPCVLKPLTGTRGRDVFVVRSADEPNLGALIDVLLRDGFAIAQGWVEGAEAGDTRLVFLRGRPLVVEGQVAAIRRVPAAGELRSNLHAGGRPAPAELTDDLQRVADAVGPVLAAEDIFLAGADVIGDRVIELNVFSTGGLHAAEGFTGVSFCDAIIAALEEQHAA